jgi:hypothetical protein
MGKGRSPWQDGSRAWQRLRDWRTESTAAPHNGDDALEALGDVGRVRHLLDQAELTAVKTARAHGKSWAEIATMLGVTRQSAWEKWRDLDVGPAAGARSVRLQTPDDVLVGEVVGEVVDRALAQRAERSSVLVPDVIGLAWPDARDVLAKAWLVPVAPAVGGLPLPEPGEPGAVVVDQTPKAGARRAAGSAVTVWIEHGGGAGVREPRVPKPTMRSARGERDEESQEAIG